MNNLAKIDTDAELYVLHVGQGAKHGYSCLGFDVVAREGRAFIFRNIPWQSGGEGPEILEG